MSTKKRITTKMIADHIGMSQSTVSMILSGKKNVSFSEETKQRVLSAAAELGYEKKRKSDKKLNQELSNTIMVICPTFANNYYAMVIHSISERAKQYGYSIFIAPTLRDSDTESYYLDLFKEMNLCGVIYLYPPAMVYQANALSEKIPVISIGEKSMQSKFDAIELDRIKPGFLVGSHLLDLGHRKVTYITSPIHRHEVGRSDRLEGIRSAFKENGLSADQVTLMDANPEDYQLYSPDNAEYRNGYDQTIKLLKKGTDSTALVGNNDLTAFGIMCALSDMGYKIPRDFSVCGFDNIPLSAMAQISLTTIEHASDLKGIEAVDLIHRKIAMKKNARSSRYNYIVRLEYEPELIIRKSTGKCRRKDIAKHE
ncbi:MAG: LacI family transcriptional regulator [Lachnospiraceae bacterium]|nr:LacI family transcriptional regulator [Lachnospiraceae bacterium]